MTQTYLETLKQNARHNPDRAIEEAYQLGIADEKFRAEDEAIAKAEAHEKTIIAFLDCLVLGLVSSFLALLTWQSLLRIAIAGGIGFSIRFIIYLYDFIK